MPTLKKSTDWDNSTIVLPPHEDNSTYVRLEVKQGTTVSFVFSQYHGNSYSPRDLRDSVIAAEITNGYRGLTPVEGFIASVTSGSDLVTLNPNKEKTCANPTAIMNAHDALDRNPFSRGDFVTLPDANLYEVEIEAVTASTLILKECVSEVTLNNIRLYRIARVLASFTPIPKIAGSGYLEVAGDALGGETLLNILPLEVDIPQGSRLSIEDLDGAIVSRRDALCGDSQIETAPLPGDIPNGTKIGIRPQSIVNTQEIVLAANTVEIQPLAAPLPAGQVLHFASRKNQDIFYGGNVVLTFSANTGDTTLSISTSDFTIPANSWAMTGPVPFPSVELVLHPEQTHRIFIGDRHNYKWDLKIRFRDGNVWKPVKGDVILHPQVSDVLTLSPVA